MDVVVKEAVGRPRRGRSRRNRNGRGGNAPVATSLSISSKSTPTVTLFGTDRLIHVPNLYNFNSGSVVVDLPIQCSTFGRMAHMSDAYQRVRFKKLVFRVVPMCPTNATGGLAAAFVADATDTLGSGPDALNRLVASTGSKIAKAWQSFSINAKFVRDCLYTSVPPTGDLRLSSPGRLWVVVESRCQVPGFSSTAIPLTVYCDWEVEFSVSSLEREHPAESFSLTVGATFYSRKDHVGLWWMDNSGGDDPRSKIPGIMFNTTYRTKQKYYLSYQKAGNFDKFRLIQDKDHGVTFCPVAPDGTPIVEKTEINQYVFESGDVLTPVDDPKVIGQEFLCRQTRSSLSETPSWPCQDGEPERKSKPSMTSMRSSERLKLLSRTSEDNLSREERMELLLQELQMGCPSTSRGTPRSPSLESFQEL